MILGQSSTRKVTTGPGTFILFSASIFRQEDEKQKHVDKLRKRLEEKKKKLAQEKEPEEAEGGEEAEKKEKKKKKKKDKDKEKEKEEDGEGKDEKKKKKKKKKDKGKDEDWRFLMFRKIIFGKEKILFSFQGTVSYSCPVFLPVQGWSKCQI